MLMRIFRNGHQAEMMYKITIRRLKGFLTYPDIGFFILKDQKVQQLSIKGSIILPSGARKKATQVAFFVCILNRPIYYRSTPHLMLLLNAL
jgi:hypothetical protein